MISPLASSRSTLHRPNSTIISILPSKSCPSQRVQPISPFISTPLTLRSVKMASHGSKNVLASASSSSSSLFASVEPKDLLIVGPGVLGSVAGMHWKQAFPKAVVMGQTNSTTNHPTLQKLGLQTRSRDAAASSSSSSSSSSPSSSPSSFPFVLFAAPPSGSADYIADIKNALHQWDKRGSFVFTSSAGVYAAEDLSAVDESSPTFPLGSNERTDKLLQAEETVLQAGGIVVRLVGLYHLHRGAHTFFLKQGTVARWGGYTVNLIHYEDAARLCVQALQGNKHGDLLRGKVLLGADNHPITFDDMMRATLASGKFDASRGVSFTGAEGPVKGKRVNNDQTRKELGWAPKYPSYKQFMENPKDVYTETAAGGLGMKHA